MAWKSRVSYGKQLWSRHTNFCKKVTKIWNSCFRLKGFLQSCTCVSLTCIKNISIIWHLIPLSGLPNQESQASLRYCTVFYLYTGQRSSKLQMVHLQHWQSVLFTAKYFRRYFIFRYKTHIILILSFKRYPIFEHLTSFMEQLLMYFRRHKRMETNVVKGHFATKSFRPWDVSGPRLFFVYYHIQKLVRVLHWLKH